MNLLLPAANVSPGDQYLVDLGRLVPVAAVNARSAYRIALNSVGIEPEFPESLHEMAPRVYQLDPQGELIAVFD
jgi:hypothetical protein